MKQKRVIKFRAWDEGAKGMHPPMTITEIGLIMREQELASIDAVAFKFAFESLIWMRWTGLFDKNGKEIYESDLLRIKGDLGESGAKYDVIYKVLNLSYAGLELYGIRLFNSEPDSKENSVPIHTSLSFEHRSLCVDYKNDEMDHLALPETHGENTFHRQRWIQNRYTNDIEVIGDIYTTPELLTPGKES